jgi:hypothetical protein
MFPLFLMRAERLDQPDRMNLLDRVNLIFLRIGLCPLFLLFLTPERIAGASTSSPFGYFNEECRQIPLAGIQPQCLFFFFLNFG